MARRSDHGKDELKQLAIDAGYTLLQNQGLEALSARKVASEIGYTVGTIYNIFKTHDLFLLHIQGKILDHLSEQLSEFLKNQLQPVSVLDLARFYYGYSQQHYQTWSLLFHHIRQTDEDIPQWYQDKMNALFETLENILLPDVDGDKQKAHLSARVLWSSLHGICILSLSGKLNVVDAKTTDILIQNLIMTYLNGLKK